MSACLRDRNSSSRAWFNASAAWTSLTARAGIVELLEGDTGEQVLFDIVERLELIVLCHRVGIAIALSHPALVVALLCREQARTVVVQKWRQPVPVKGVDLPREALRDVGVAEPLPHHRMRSCSPPGRCRWCAGRAIW